MQDERFKTGEKVTFPARYKWISHTGDASCTINHDPYVKELDENERFGNPSRINRGRLGDK